MTIINRASSNKQTHWQQDWKLTNYYTRPTRNSINPKIERGNEELRTGGATNVKQFCRNNHHRQDENRLFRSAWQPNAISRTFVLRLKAINDSKLINQKWISGYVSPPGERDVTKRTSIIVMPYVQFRPTPHDLEKLLYNYRLQVFTCRKLGNKYVEARCVREARFNLVNSGFNVRTSRP